MSTGDQIDLDALLVEVDAAYQEDVGSAPDDMSRARASVLARIGFGRDPSLDWPQRFTPMVLLYPSLHAEGLGESSSRTLRVNLAHLYLLIYMVIDDRRRDGQIVLSVDEATSMMWFFERALDILSEIVPEEDLRLLVGTVSNRYELGDSKLSRPALEQGTMALAEARAIVIGRSYWGIFAVLALLSRQGASPERLLMAVDAFESLVWAMQLIDDLGDWREDLESGDDNLMLLSVDRGPDIQRNPAVHVAQWSLELLRRQGIPHVISLARQGFEHAEAAQNHLGNPMLAGLIRERINSLTDIERMAIRRCESDVFGAVSELTSGCREDVIKELDN